MSLGWLTESSLVPKEPKPIERVGTASLLRLQAAVYERERRGPAAKRCRREDERNEGVEARDAGDQAALAKKGPAGVAAALAEKARRYEGLVSGRAAGGADALVDFSRRRALEAELSGDASAAQAVEVADAAAAAATEDTADTARRAASVTIAPPACLHPGVATPSSRAALAPPSMATQAVACQFPPLPPGLASPGPAPSARAPAALSAPVSCGRSAGQGSVAAGAQGAVRQAFERRLLTHDEALDRIRASEATALSRDTVGQDRRARDAVRDRLAALRAAKAKPS